MAYLNKYALIARAHIKKHQSEMYGELRASGQLIQYVSDLGEQISDMVDNVRIGILEKNPPPINDFRKRLQGFAWANQSAEEIALNDLVYNALPREEASD